MLPPLTTSSSQVSLANQLQYYFPDLEIKGGYYPVADSTMVRAQRKRSRRAVADAATDCGSRADQDLIGWISTVRWALIAFALTGNYVFKALGMETPDFAKPVTDNPGVVSMLVFFAANAATSSLVATGAFEVEYGNELLFSKIDSGRVPQAWEILEGLERLGLRAIARG